MLRYAIAALAAAVTVAAPSEAYVVVHSAPSHVVVVHSGGYGYHAPVIVHHDYGYHPYYAPHVIVVPHVMHCGYNLFGQRVCHY